ncbi:putative transposase [Arthrobacter globiformis NBRC 12137]|uniref:Putative transposase n=1 Tax=Arthrobacter globiformis (strain ATCC 8010 / DSM 20124 / JCM 1332 / NBRC 12137 / NCIMB 8907 / NRRL B-2979 / 168) TaxID=1077972 RepID=H0QK25_ARTG1|nr:putative transposase [Arthrobacter globiformis NBRC 12137]
MLFAYRLSLVFQDALAGLGAKHILIKPRHPWQNGKAERFNRTLQEGWAYRQPFTSNQAATMAKLLQQTTGPTAASEANHPSAGATNLLADYC